MLSCQHRPHPTSPHPRASRPARPPLVSLNACLSESLCCALIQDHCGAVLSPCSEPGIAPTALNAQHPFCSACCVSALLVTHFPGLLSFFFFFSYCLFITSRPWCLNKRGCCLQDAFQWSGCRSCRINKWDAKVQGVVGMFFQFSTTNILRGESRSGGNSLYWSS